MSNRYLSKSQLSELTGFDRRTVRERLADLQPSIRPEGANGKGHYYDTREALPLLYKAATSNDVSKQLNEESLRYERGRADRIEIEVAKLRGELVGIEEVAKTVEKQYTFVRSQLRSIPSKLAKPVTLAPDANVVHKLITDAIDECLTELTADINYSAQVAAIEAEANNIEQIQTEPEGEEPI
jgi:phage terminase Nu1 subunit (DNA packaging protein)